VKDTTSVAVLKTFLTHYPEGLYADFATARIAELEAAAERVAALEAEARAAATPPPAPAPAPEVETATREAEPDEGADIPQAGGGNWFVVLGSFPHADRRKATRRVNSLQSQGIDAEIIDTDDYPNLTDGYYAVVLGPYSKATAQRTLPTAREYVADAYIKAGS
jgi:cell division septation protein DedD